MRITPPRIERVHREPVAVQVAHALLQYLLYSDEVRVGERIPSERELADAFGVGRSAVREALKSLSLLGLVEIRQGDGTYLCRPDGSLLPKVIEWGLLLSPERLEELVEARFQLEAALARLAAERRSEQAVGDLRGLLERMRASQADPERFLEADVAFHLRLAACAGNQVLGDMLATIQALLRVWIRRVLDADYVDSPERSLSYEAHVALFAAVERRDPDAAAAAMRVMQTVQSRLAAGTGAAGQPSRGGQEGSAQPV